MTNSYYNNTRTFTFGTRARGEAVDDDFDAVEAAFDSAELVLKRSIKLPSSVTTDQVITANAGNRASKVVGFDSSGDLALVALSVFDDSPAISTGDAGKIVNVNSGETGYELSEPYELTYGGTSAAGTDAYAVSLSISPGAYATGQNYQFIADVDNTGACTVNFNSIGVTSIKLPDGSDPYNGAIQANSVVDVCYDGTNFILLNPHLETTSFSRSILDDTDEATFKATVNLEIGTDVQAYDAGLQSISGLTTAADKMIYTTALDTYAVTDLSSYGRSLIAVANESAFKSLVNLEIGTDVQAYDAQLADIAGLTPTDGNFIVGNGTNFAAESGATARTSLGLGTIATQDANSVAITGGTVNGTTIGGVTPAAGAFTTLSASGGGSLTGTWSDLGSVTTVDINGGTIDGVTIATSDITVGAGKTLDVSAGTLTLANDQISGNAIDGGAISNFASTGIDDNASSTVLTLADGGVALNGASAQTNYSLTTAPTGTGAGLLYLAGNNSNGAFIQVRDSLNAATRGYLGYGSSIFSGGAISDFGLNSPGELVFSSGGGTIRASFATDGGLYMTGATGSSQGAGTGNFTALYVNGNAVPYKAEDATISGTWNFTATPTVSSNAVYYATGADVPVTDGGTGASTAAGARTNLEVQKLVMLDTPELLAGPDLTFNAWTTVNSTTLGTAGATTAILRVAIEKETSANDINIYLRKTGSGLGLSFGTRVAWVSDSDVGAISSSNLAPSVLQKLDSNSDFDYYYQNSGGSTIGDEGDIYLIGYYI